MKDREEGRWLFLKATVIASAVLAISLSAGSQAQQTFSGWPYEYPITADTVMSVSLTGDLHDTYDPVDVALGTWSDPVSLKGKGVYRVKVVQKTANVDPGLGPVFTFILADANEKELGRMNLGDSAMGTFGAYGIQAYISSSALSAAFLAQVQGHKPAPVPADRVLPADTLMHVSLRGNLYDPPESVELAPGAWSDPVQLKDKGTFRVKLTQVTDGVNSALGPVFTFILADADGKEIGRENLGNSATGTFTNIGVQAYIAMAIGNHNRDPVYSSVSSNQAGKLPSLEVNSISRVSSR